MICLLCYYFHLAPAVPHAPSHRADQVVSAMSGSAQAQTVRAALFTRVAVHDPARCNLNHSWKWNDPQPLPFKELTALINHVNASSSAAKWMRGRPSVINISRGRDLHYVTPLAPDGHCLFVWKMIWCVNCLVKTKMEGVGIQRKGPQQSKAVFQLFSVDK